MSKATWATRVLLALVLVPTTAWEGHAGEPAWPVLLSDEGGLELLPWDDDRGMSAEPGPARPPRGAPASRSSGPVERPFALPVDRSRLSYASLLRPHHDYPAWDLALPLGTVVRAVKGGRVIDATAGGRCGIGVEILAGDGSTYTYCHGARALVTPGESVAAGEPILLSGNSGRSRGPHLHLQVENPEGRLICPQQLLVAWWEGRDASPSAASGYGCSYATPDKAKRRRKNRARHERAPSIGRRRARAARGAGPATAPAPPPAPEPRRDESSSAPRRDRDGEPRPAPSREPNGEPSPDPSPSPEPEPTPSDA